MKLVKDRLRQGESASSYYVFSEVNQRLNNEDSFFTYYLPTSQQKIIVLSIADGMGGLGYGEEVSRETLRKVYLALCERLIVDQSLNNLEREPVVDISWLAQAVEEAIKEANDFVLRMICNNNWKRAGSTIAVAAILDNTVVVISLGDSPVFHYERCTGHLSKMTIDHTVANLQFLEGKITAEMAQHHSGRSVLKRHIGQEKLPDSLEASACELEEGDLLLLCTDGVSGRLSEQQIADILSAPQDLLEEIAQQLIETALQAGEEDNQTLILWQHCPVSSEQKEENRMAQEQLADLATRLAAVEQNQLDIKARLMTVEEQLHTANEKLEALDEKVEEEEQKIEEVEQQIEEEDWASEFQIPEEYGKYTIGKIDNGEHMKQHTAIQGGSKQREDSPTAIQEEKAIAVGEEEEQAVEERKETAQEVKTKEEEKTEK